jgi:hypothetical protein
MFWVGVTAAIVVAILALVGAVIGYTVFRGAQQAGVTREMLESNPNFAVNKLAVAMRPDLETVSEDPDKNEILVKSRKTGELFVHRMDARTKRFVLAPVETAEGQQ